MGRKPCFGRRQEAGAANLMGSELLCDGVAAFERRNHGFQALAIHRGLGACKSAFRACSRACFGSPFAA